MQAVGGAHRDPITVRCSALFKVQFFYGREDVRNGIEYLAEGIIQLLVTKQVYMYMGQATNTITLHGMYRP